MMCSILANFWGINPKKYTRIWIWLGLDNKFLVSSKLREAPLIMSAIIFKVSVSLGFCDNIFVWDYFAIMRPPPVVALFPWETRRNLPALHNMRHITTFSHSQHSTLSTFSHSQHESQYATYYNILTLSTWIHLHCTICDILQHFTLSTRVLAAIKIVS